MKHKNIVFFWGERLKPLVPVVDFEQLLSAAHTQSWSNYFFQSFSTFFVNFKPFSVISLLKMNKKMFFFSYFAYSLKLVDMQKLEIKNCCIIYRKLSFNWKQDKIIIFCNGISWPLFCYSHLQLQSLIRQAKIKQVKTLT